MTEYELKKEFPYWDSSNRAERFYSWVDEIEHMRKLGYERLPADHTFVSSLTYYSASDGCTPFTIGIDPRQHNSPAEFYYPLYVKVDNWDGPDREDQTDDWVARSLERIADALERICPEHGVGHPDPDDAAYQELIGKGYMNTHGCCGCCAPTKSVMDGISDMLLKEGLADQDPAICECGNHEPCRHCGREEDGKWEQPCPSDDCPSHTPETDAVAEVRIVKGRPREIVDASFARELEKQRDLALEAWHIEKEKTKSTSR